MLSEKSLAVLAWLVDQPDGRSPMPMMPETISFYAIAELRRLRLVKSYRCVGNFRGIQITPAGRAALSHKDSRDE